VTEPTGSGDSAQREGVPGAATRAGLDRRRVWAFLGLCALATSLVAAYTTVAVTRRARPSAAARAVPLRAQPPAKPYLVVSSAEPGERWGRLVLVPAAAPASGVFVTSLSCERTHMAGGRGACLRREPARTTYTMEIFDDTFTVRRRVPLTGVPSRTRVSPDGRRAAATVFEQGHSYAEDGFSTRTTIVDTAAGTVIVDLEQFEVERDGRRFKAPDFNFWGVTFARDSDTFYATLSSGGTNYLVTGRISTRRARVVRAGVECPSLSPNGTRIAYKHRVSRDAWQLWLYDLQTGAERALSRETRNLDDQVDWLDDEHVIYQMVGSGGANVWSIEASGVAAPRLLVAHAFSPSVIR
jgi:Tol biopolymer transport system component